MQRVRNGRLDLVVSSKLSEHRPHDVVTQLDQEVEDLLVRGLLECFPGIGIVAEEAKALSRFQAFVPGRTLRNLSDKLEGHHDRRSVRAGPAQRT